MTVFHRNEKKEALPSLLTGGVVAIGNFDGVHRGHQAVLSRALERAEALGVPALVLTFEPHPRSVFNPQKPVFRLTPAPLRARILEAMGFQSVIEYPFDVDFSQRSAEDFVRSILVEWLGAREVVIRNLLAVGNVSEAAGLLGYRFTVEAEVVKGNQLGRTLGFPTANMKLAPEATLRAGIYAVRFRRADGVIRDGVASFGYRPTVTDNGAAWLETFVFDFSGDLYGETCSVSFFGHLRDEWKFDGLDPLVAQIRKDEQEARALLAGVRPIGELDEKISF